MKICIVCKKEIGLKQSKRGTGNGWAHTYCLVPKTVKPTQHMPNTNKFSK